MACKFVMIY